MIAFFRDREQATINWLTGFSGAGILLIRVFFASTPEWLADGGRIANVIADLCIAYLAAWLFYFLVSWRPAYKLRLRIAVPIAQHAFQAQLDMAELLRILCPAAGVEKYNEFERSDVEEACQKLYTGTTTSLRQLATGRMESVAEALAHYIPKVRADASSIVEMAALFDADVVSQSASIANAQLALNVADYAAMAIFLIAPGAPLADQTDAIWDLAIRADRLWLTMVARHRAAALAVHPHLDIALPTFKHQN